MVAADAWTTVGGVASVVAAAAALVTIIYARATVQVAREARQEARRDHAQSLAAEREAASAAVAEQRAAIEAAAAAHHEEMADRARAFEAEIVLERIVQLERIADVLSELVDVARDEHVSPPPQLAPPSPFRATRLPAMLERVRTGMSILAALGAPELPALTRLVNEGANYISNPMQLVALGRDSLVEVGRIVQRDEHFRILPE